MEKLNLLFLPALFFSSLVNASIIDTTSSWDGVLNTSSFGEGSTTSYGQTFVTNSVDTALNSFSFWLDDKLTPDPVEFSAYIMAWSDRVGIREPAHAIGSILYQSEMRTSTNNNGLDGMELFTFNTGGLGLESNQKYVAIISVVEYIDGIHGTSGVGSVGRNDSNFDAYVEGDQVIQNSIDLSSFTSSGWNVAEATKTDLAFSASLSIHPVPAPPALILFLTGLIGIAVFERFKGTRFG